MHQVLGPYTLVRDLEETSSSQLQNGPALAMAAIWRVNQEMEDFSLSVSFSICNSDFQVMSNLLCLEVCVDAHSL